MRRSSHATEWSRTVLFVAVLLVASSVAASDFSGFYTLFVGMPALVLFDFFLGVIVSCRLAQSRLAAARGALFFCVIGVLVSSYWLGLMSGGPRWYVFAALVLFLGTTIGVLCLSTFKDQRRKIGATMARGVLGMAVLAGCLIAIEITFTVSKSGDAGGAILIVPCLFLLAVAFQLCRLAAREYSVPCT